MAKIFWKQDSVVDAKGRRCFSIICCENKTVKYATPYFDAYNVVNDCVLKNLKGDDLSYYLNITNQKGDFMITRKEFEKDILMSIYNCLGVV